MFTFKTAPMGLTPKQADASQYVHLRDLNILCRVSKYFYGITIPALYKFVTLTSARRGVGEAWRHVDALLQAPVSPVDLLVHVREESLGKP